MAAIYTLNHHIGTSHATHLVLSPPSLFQSHNFFFPCLILVKILPQSSVLLMDISISSHFFETSARKQIFLTHHDYLTSFHTHHVPLGLKRHLIGFPCLHGPSKVHCNPHLPVSAGWTFIMAGHAPDIHHCTYTQQTAYNALNPCISPPLEPPIKLSFFSHTTTSDTSSEFTAYNHIKITTPSKDSCAVFEQDSNKCLIPHHGELSAEIFWDYMTRCWNYVTNKEIDDNKQMIKVMTVLKEYIWEGSQFTQSLCWSIGKCTSSSVATKWGEAILRFQKREFKGLQSQVKFTLKQL